MTFDMKQTIIYSIHILSVLTILAFMVSCGKILSPEFFSWSYEFDMNGKHCSDSHYAKGIFLGRVDEDLFRLAFDGYNDISFHPPIKLYDTESFEKPTILIYLPNLLIRLSKNDDLPFKEGEQYNIENADIHAVYIYGSLSDLEVNMISCTISMSHVFKWGVGRVLDVQFEFEEEITESKSDNFKVGDRIMITNGHYFQAPGRKGYYQEWTELTTAYEEAEKKYITK